MNLSTLIICAVIAAIGVTALISFKNRLKNGCCGSGGGDIRIRAEDENEDNYAHEATVSISGMTCKNCAVRVENAFNRREGFWARVSLGKKRAKILSKTEISADDIKRTIEQAGYTVTDIVTEK